MTYTLDPNIRPNPLLPWIYVFMLLSIKQCSQVREELDFPFDPPENVRQLAHDFALTFENMSRNSEYAATLENLRLQGEAVSINLLEGTSPEEHYEKRCEALFTNTFAYLERMGYAESVNRWGKQTSTYYKYTDRQRYADFDALSDWCYLLRKWAVLEWLKQPLSPERVPHSLYSVYWDKLIAKFAPIFTKSNHTLEPLQISEVSRVTLQAIVLHHEAKKLYLETTMDQIMASAQTVWEDFALNSGTGDMRIRLEGALRINLREWNMIMDTLSADEMDILGQWALKDTYKWRHLKVPLPDFRVASSGEMD